MTSSRKLPLFFFLFSLFIHASLCEIICEDLPIEICTFSIATSGKRCSLETSMSKKDRKIGYQCKTSEVIVERMSGYIETSACIDACGVDRKAVGISSDSFFEPYFASKLCSHACYHNCPNIVDLYFNLAAAEGAFLPDLCKKSRRNPRRAMMDLLSFGAALKVRRKSDQIYLMLSQLFPIVPIFIDTIKHLQ
ncbi:hypothetical protein ACFE04_001278 [Oxalis oulophora]